MSGGHLDPAWPPPYPGEAVGLPSERRRSGHGGWGADLVVVLGVLALLGLVCGVVWSRVVDPPLLTRFESHVGQDESQLAQVFAADGWYVLIGGGTALVAGAVLGWLRRRDPVVTVLLLVAGSAVAATVMAVTGHLLGPPDPRLLLQSAPVGTTAPAMLEVTSSATYLAWPVGVVLGGLLPLLLGRD